MDKKKTEVLLEDGKEKAKEILKNEKKQEIFLQQLEQKLESVPLIGDQLSEIPVLAGMLKAYLKKEYRAVPLGSILAVISVLGYFVAPFDFVPDLLGLLGYADDAAVLLACMRLVESDVSQYREWQYNRDKKE